MEYILLVTWFVSGQSPASYQVRFGSSESCSQARIELQKEEARLKDLAEEGSTGDAEVAEAATPRLSAVCARF